MKCHQNSFELVKAAAIVCIIAMTAASTASAQWGSQGGGGSSGFHSSSAYGSSGDGYRSSGGSLRGAGPIKRLGARIHDHHAAKQSYRQNAGYGSSGGYGSTGGNGSSGGFTTSYQVVSNVSSNPITSTAVARQRPLQSSMAVLPAATDSSVQLVVEVPTGAKLFVNERATTSTGSTRQFVSRDLERGRKYEFRVRAEVMDKNGKLISETKQVSVQAGDSETLKFTFMNRSQLFVASMRTK